MIAFNSIFMVEVFKTNIADNSVADQVVTKIHEEFGIYHANFDLEDCDHILRVENTNGIVEAEPIINLVAKNGFFAETLADELLC